VPSVLMCGGRWWPHAPLRGEPALMVDRLGIAGGHAEAVAAEGQVVPSSVAAALMLPS
jgi:hypothetical protein